MVFKITRVGSIPAFLVLRNTNLERVKGHFRRPKQFKFKKNNLNIFSHSSSQKKLKVRLKSNSVRKSLSSVSPIFQNNRRLRTVAKQLNNYLLLLLVKSFGVKSYPFYSLLLKKYSTFFLLKGCKQSPLFLQTLPLFFTNQRASTCYFLINNFFSLRVLFSKNFDKDRNFSLITTKSFLPSRSKFYPRSIFSNIRNEAYFLPSLSTRRLSSDTSSLLKIFSKAALFTRISKRYGSKKLRLFSLIKKIYSYSYLNYSRIFFYDLDLGKNLKSKHEANLFKVQ